MLGSIDCLISVIGYISPAYIQSNRIWFEFEGGRRWFIRVNMTSALLILSINRYIAAKMPLKINVIFSRRNSCALICASWIFATLIAAIIKLADQRPALYRPFEGCCLLRSSVTTTSALMVCLFFPMTSAIAYFNIAIFKIVKNHRKRIANQTGHLEYNFHRQNERLLNITLVILISFLISHSPVPVFVVMDDAVGKPMPLIWYIDCAGP